MRIDRLVLSFLVCAALIGCQRLEASRNFHSAVALHNKREYGPAVQLFRRAAELHDHPVILYNLAVSGLAWARQSKGADLKTLESRCDRVRSVAVRARSAGRPSARRLAQLHYLEGSAEVLAGNQPAARAAFEAALQAKAGYKPALKALIELSAEGESRLAQLVLATVDIQEPQLEKTLRFKVSSRTP